MDGVRVVSGENGEAGEGGEGDDGEGVMKVCCDVVDLGRH